MSMPTDEQPAAQDQELLALARELRRRSETLLERYAPAAQVRADRLVMVGDAGVMECAAGVIKEALSHA